MSPHASLYSHHKTSAPRWTTSLPVSRTAYSAAQQILVPDWILERGLPLRQIPCPRSPCYTTWSGCSHAHRGFVLFHCLLQRRRRRCSTMYVFSQLFQEDLHWSIGFARSPCCSIRRNWRSLLSNCIAHCRNTTTTGCWGLRIPYSAFGR